MIGAEDDDVVFRVAAAGFLSVPIARRFIPTANLATRVRQALFPFDELIPIGQVLRPVMPSALLVPTHVPVRSASLVAP